MEWRRGDGKELAASVGYTLAIEGGGNRAAYSAGMALALDEAGLTAAFDDVYGTSGGALNAAWLLVTQQGWIWASVGVIVALVLLLPAQRAERAAGSDLHAHAVRVLQHLPERVREVHRAADHVAVSQSASAGRRLSASPACPAGWRWSLRSSRTRRR